MIRPGSKSDAGTTHTQDAEKRDSPETVPSSEPTAVPSPNEQPLDYEKAGEERQRTIQISPDANSAPETTATATGNGNNLQHNTSQKRRRRATTKSSAARPNLGVPVVEEVMGREEAEELLGMVQGVLVEWPYDW